MDDSEIKLVLESHAQNGLVTICGTDSSPEFQELIANYACNLKQFGMCPLIWSLDEATHQKLLGGNIGNVPIGSIYSDKLMLQQDSSMQSSFKANQFKESGSDAYMAAVAFKPLVMREVLRLGFDLLWLDIDVALASDPRPWLAKHPQATVAISMNYPNPMVNSGVVYARTGGSGTLPLFTAWAEKAIRHECKAINCGDQEMFQQFMEDGCNMQQVSHIDQTEMQYAVRQKLTCNLTKGSLPVVLDSLSPRMFCDGRSGNMIKARLAPVVTYHANYGKPRPGVKKQQLSKMHITGLGSMWKLDGRGNCPH
eukprot:CAMPEP_0172607434 /NCGR_PEP_ID=MMETSP1068-20121228/27622_1 /TAXON_ID=35684 /ORGANISM="Pseudopedinella elastica, Strain CCMP716" /LENGTH=309 /DNA_ID=CAMNT_0013410445 /DNA_START=215 /DNA_END=1144 /DNA_ORIENTATION=+